MNLCINLFYGSQYLKRCLFTRNITTQTLYILLTLPCCCFSRPFHPLWFNQPTKIFLRDCTMRLSWKISSRPVQAILSSFPQSHQENSRTVSWATPGSFNKYPNQNLNTLTLAFGTERSPLNKPRINCHTWIQFSSRNYEVILSAIAIVKLAKEA
jgi:hypothetical protein